MALMDGPDFPGAMREIARVLRPGGTLAFSILHPCFATKGMGWIRDDVGRAVKFTVADYFNDEAWIEHWKFGHAPNASQVEEFARAALRSHDSPITSTRSSRLDCGSRRFASRARPSPRAHVSRRRSEVSRSYPAVPLRSRVEAVRQRMIRAF